MKIEIIPDEAPLTGDVLKKAVSEYYEYDFEPLKEHDAFIIPQPIAKKQQLPVSMRFELQHYLLFALYPDKYLEYQQLFPQDNKLSHKLTYGNFTEELEWRVNARRHKLSTKHKDIFFYPTETSSKKQPAAKKINKQTYEVDNVIHVNFGK